MRAPDHTRHVSIKCKGTKRPRENLVLVLYDAGETELAIPFIRGEDPQLFFERRDKITRETLEAEIRNDVYCTWRKEMLSVLINDKRWQLIRDSPQQKRHVYDAIQLVVTHSIHLHSVALGSSLPQLLKPALACSLPEDQAHLPHSTHPQHSQPLPAV